MRNITNTPMPYKPMFHRRVSLNMSVYEVFYYSQFRSGKFIIVALLSTSRYYFWIFIFINICRIIIKQIYLINNIKSNFKTLIFSFASFDLNFNYFCCLAPLFVFGYFILKLMQF